MLVYKKFCYDKLKKDDLCTPWLNFTAILELKFAFAEHIHNLKLVALQNIKCLEDITMDKC